MPKLRRFSFLTADVLDALIFLASLITLLFWLTGAGIFYSETHAVLSPLTSFSLLLMVVTRLASRHIFTWSGPMTLALLGLVACGNLSSLLVHLMTPELFLHAAPHLVPTSMMTSLGLILFCLYEILVELRPSPRTAFIVDDVLLHLALFPGGLSFLGLILGVQAYRSSSVDPRVGISVLEMILMAGFAVAAVLKNQNLFLWAFLRNKPMNFLVFGILFINQYVASFIFGWFFRPPELGTWEFGIAFYIMLAGVLTTLVFLIFQAIYYYGRFHKKSQTT